MRDTNRIKSFLKSFESLWNEYPDLRFGQLIHILKVNGNLNRDTFYVEDEDFLEAIEKYLRNKGEDNYGNV